MALAGSNLGFLRFYIKLCTYVCVCLSGFQYLNISSLRDQIGVLHPLELDV